MAKPTKIADVPAAGTVVMSDCHVSVSTADAATKSGQNKLGASPGDTIVTVVIPGMKPYTFIGGAEADALKRAAVAKALAEGQERSED